MAKEPIHWVAIYSDGTSLKEFDGDISNGYNKIDRTKLVAFALYKNDYQDKLLTIHFQDDQRLIWRKREYVKPGGGRFVVHIAGWQQTVRGENIQSVAYIFPDGRIELGGKWQEGHALFDPVELMAFEK